MEFRMLLLILVEFAKANRSRLLVALLFLYLLAQQQGMILTGQPPLWALRRLPSLNTSSSKPPAYAAKLEEIPKRTGIYNVTRHMFGFGVTAAEYTFVLSGAYRIGAGSFAIVGLGPKSLHSFGKPQFECHWDGDNQAKPLVGSTAKYLPDWGYGRAYTVVVVHCHFANKQATQFGGKLRFFASNGRNNTDTESIIAIEERPGDYKESNFPEGRGFKYKYEYLYCGSSLYGDVDPDRLSEWLAYHAMLFGKRSHFVLHDVGALKSEASQQVLKPWVQAGLVTVQDFAEENNYDGYYHNQFLIVNDCLFRYKHAAKWTFFFDIDEYLYVAPPETLSSVLDKFGKNNIAQIMFEQNIMSHNVCLAESQEDQSRQWDVEKLVFKCVKKRDNNRKYVVRAGLADSTGVHLSQHVRGKSLYSNGMLKYYHYHDTISKHGNTCKAFVEKPKHTKDVLSVKNVGYIYDATMVSLAAKAREFQQRFIGNSSKKSIEPW